MVGMAIVGLAGSRLASNRRDKLEEQRERKVEARGRELQSLRRTAEGIAYDRA